MGSRVGYTRTVILNRDDVLIPARRLNESMTVATRTVIQNKG